MVSHQTLVLTHGFGLEEGFYREVVGLVLDYEVVGTVPDYWAWFRRWVLRLVLVCFRCSWCFLIDSLLF